MGEEKSARRQQTWIDSDVQGALIRRLFLHWLLFFVNVMLLGTFVQFIADPTQSIVGHLANIWQNQMPFLIIMVVMLPMFVFDTISVSNRFVGPVYKLRAAMKALRRGEVVQPIFFRKGDFWSGLADDFNALLGQTSQIGSEVSVPNAAPTADPASR